ncbi:MAG TPA: N-acetylmuramoyl-L-alanine amidase [Blastocatellia bacterium]|nr:N-acetylmuramoyl-L-alanine amidase [Blastocatellia bacterium]
MRKPERYKLVVRMFVFAVVFCLTARPILNAADPASASSGVRTAAENLFLHASDLVRSLHQCPPEERTLSDYRRALDAFSQVIRLNTDNYFSAESFIRRAELLREMADVTGDAALYQDAIETYRRVVIEQPHSSFVGEALISIAQIYEENLQDLDGAAAAYRELIAHFPKSALAREAEAVLARFDSQLGNRPVDVMISADRVRKGDGAMGLPRLTNVRNFSGPDYARVVIDLSDEAAYSERRADNRVSIQLNDVSVSSSLYGRRFIVDQSSLLKRILVKEGEASGVQVEIEVGALADYSMFRLSEPARIVIDLHAKGAAAKLRANDSIARTATKEDSIERAPRADGVASKPSVAASQSPLLALPDIPDPIVPMNPQDAQKAADALAAKVDAKAAEAPIKRIVIDPGHGGHDTGTISPNGMREKDLVLDVARRLRAYIKHNYPDVEVIMTRDSDRFVALEERTAIANARAADLFISIHANASPSRAASGVETFFLSPDRAASEDLQAAARENARMASEKKSDGAQTVVASITAGNRVAQSRELARYIQAGMVRGIGAQSPRTAVNRGVKHAPFVVLVGAAMPSVLAEVSFLSNERDEALLQTAAFRDRIAASLFGGLNAYLKKNRAAEAKAK